MKEKSTRRKLNVVGVLLLLLLPLINRRTESKVNKQNIGEKSSILNRSPLNVSFNHGHISSPSPVGVSAKIQYTSFRVQLIRNFRWVSPMRLRWFAELTRFVYERLHNEIKHRRKWDAENGQSINK